MPLGTQWCQFFFWAAVSHNDFQSPKNSAKGMTENVEKEAPTACVKFLLLRANYFQKQNAAWKSEYPKKIFLNAYLWFKETHEKKLPN